jgi:autotransporter translocation and assembly factor TamB
VDVTAEWRSPEGTIVYVDVVGTMNDAKVALRSDPPLPEPQVFAILLGGSSSPDSFAGSEDSQSSGGDAAGAVGISSGVAALGLNELLGNSPVEIRIGTTSESKTRYTAAVRIGENLWFEASTYQTSSSEIGGNDQNVFSGTVDYRFTRNWSLRTELGTAGGALDLLWQYRY